MSSIPVQPTVNHSFQQHLLLQHQHQQQQQQHQQHQQQHQSKNNSSVMALLNSSGNIHNANDSTTNDNVDNSKFQINSFQNHPIFQHNDIPNNHSINIRVSPMINQQQQQQRTTSANNEKQTTDISNLDSAVEALHNSFVSHLKFQVKKSKKRNFLKIQFF